ncbi:MAG: hypothetical protein H7Y38_11890 [Armatimonadetes bacterium]|nr:hypothetical protein [Armatimonadota bacterium]
MPINFFGKSPVTAPPSVETAVAEVMAHLQARRPVDAEARMREHVAAVVAFAGERSAAFNESQAGLAGVLKMLGKTRDSLAAFQAAQDWEPPIEDAATHKDWLTFVTDYGQELGAAGELAEAETVLKRGLAGRLAFYGREHPGYAFGLEPLVSVLLAQERYAEAAMVQEEVIDNFAASGHPRFLQALLILGAARVASGAVGPALAGFSAPDRAKIEELANVAPDVLGAFPHPFRQPVLVEVAELAATHCPDSLAHRNLLAQIVNNEAEQDAPNYALRVEYAQKLFALLERARDYANAGHALLGLALAQGDAGDIPGATKSYRRVRIAGERMGDFAQASAAERNLGLLLSKDRQENAEAEACLQNAVALAKRSDDTEALGKAEGCLGVYYQHIERFADAEPLLISAMPHLPVSSSDAVIMRAHLAALRANISCGCDEGNMESAFYNSLCAAISAQVEAELPGLLKSVVYEADASGERSLQVSLLRSPLPEEMERLQIVVTQAEASFKRSVVERN